MRKINAVLASIFVFAVLAATPLYTDFIDNPGITVDAQAPKVPNVMGSASAY
jgi:hypothetical protein